MSAISLAKRVAEERKTNLGEEVGYLIQSDRRVSDSTKIFFMTTGYFIAKLTAEIDDITWTHIILDEVHERSIEMDFLLVLIKHILHKKKDLKLVLMSATLDSEVFANYFAASSVENIHDIKAPEGVTDTNWFQRDIRRIGPGVQRTSCLYREHMEDAADTLGAGGKPFEVETAYLDQIFAELKKFMPFVKNFDSIEKLDPLFRGSGDDKLEEVDERLLKLAVYIVYWQHSVRKDEPEGTNFSFLIFLPGLHEINTMADMLHRYAGEIYDQLDICILHSSMPEEHHSKVFDECEPGKRRVILSTNIAESSVTLPDVRFVIDLGFSKEISYNSLTRMQVLELKWASKATMNQRKGRAGRVAKGICFRLMPKQFYETMLYEYSKPEIQRCPLDKLILRLKQIPEIGTPADVLHRTIEPPDLEEIARTEKYLRDMGALDLKNKLTWLGTRYAEMPCDIRITRLMIYGYIFGVAKEGFLIAAILSQERPPVPSPSILSSKKQGMSSKYYSARMVYDGSNNSDPLTMLNAFFEWKAHVGKFVCKRIRASFRRGNTDKTYLNQKERNYCADKFVDPYIMREIYQTYLEYRKRLNTLDISSDLLENYLRQSVKGNIISSHGSATGAEALKLIIAAAFKGHYLVADYAVSEPSKRSKLVQRLGEDDNKFIIPNVPEGVEPDHIVNLLEDSRDQHISVVIDNGYAHVNLSSPYKSCLRMALWLGYYNNRYRNGDYVVLQRVIRSRESNDPVARQEMDDEKVLYKLPREIRLEGKIHVLEQESIDSDNDDCVEAICLSKPEYPYLLKFKDFLTNHEFRIADDSINFISMQPNESLVEQMAWVCAEYIDKAEVPMARMVTGFKASPMTAHILTMLFSRNIELLTNDQNTMYDSFMTDDSDLKYFNYRITNADFTIINQVRRFISDSISSTESFIKAPQEGITLLPSIINTIFCDRLKIMRENEHWRDVILDIHAPKTFRRRGNEVITDEDYLRQIELFEIADYDDQEFDEKQKENRLKKSEFIKELDQNFRYVELKKTELQCQYCHFTLGQYDKLEVNDGQRGWFYVNSTFGMIHFTDVLDEQSDFVNNFVDEHGGLPESWCTCSNSHVVGWSEAGRCLICPYSPVNVAFPTLVTKPWTKDLWQDNLKSLNSLSKSFEAERVRNPRPLECKLCQLEMSNEREFIRHFTLAESHQKNVKEFIGDFT